MSLLPKKGAINSSDSGSCDTSSNASGSTAGGKDKVLVAVKASKEITKTALVWALTHVAQPGDFIILLVVVPPQSPGRKLWVFPRFAGDCASGHKRSHSIDANTSATTTTEQKYEITDSCSQMILQLHEVYDPNKINVKIKIAPASPSGAVAAEAKKVQANWVVLDKQLKHEEKHCLEELHCNIVSMKKSQAKVLRLNLVGSQTKDPQVAGSYSAAHECDEDSTGKDHGGSIRGPVVTPSSSPELFTATDAGTSSVSSSDPGASPFFASDGGIIFGIKKEEESLALARKESRRDFVGIDSDTESETEYICSRRLSSQNSGNSSKDRSILKVQSSPAQLLVDRFSKLDHEPMEFGSGRYNRPDIDFTSNVREAMSLPRSAPLGPPPLCSICQHKAPMFGKPPRWFSYAELELATGGFSQANFLAEGGYGSVHRGVLPDGQAIAVKQHKLASSQGDVEFCSEVEVLSCAQHRNVVMLIGYCIEDKRRLLVYEYICNGSLDSHLYSRNREPLQWHARQKVAVGAARGLRYLHEECRVGCIVHRDMRPNNILLTHDYEPMVGDFGLARWQPDGDTGVETRVIGTFGYLAPEYAQTGQITEKADVYSFGVVLVELLTGRKAVDLTRPKGQQCLTEWARPLLEEYAVQELIDPRLEDGYSETEVHCMIHAASLCIRRDPQSRPRLSQVLRILEGDVFMDSGYMSTPGSEGSRSGRIWVDQHQHQHQAYSSPLLAERAPVYGGNFSFESLRTSLWAKEKARSSYDYDL